MVNRAIENYINDIYNYDFFNRLSIDEVNQITSNSIFHHIPKGQLIFFQDDPNIYCYFVFKGLVRLERENASGEFCYLDYVAEESFFPYAEFFFKDHHLYDAYAATDVDLAYIPKNLMENIVFKNAEQFKFLYENLASVQYYLEKRVQMTAIPSASSRVIQTLALWMYDMGRFMGDHVVIPHPLTINEAATVAGTTRETAGRVIKDLTQEKKITFTRKKIIYHDWKYFNDLIQ
ncbi:Crp/Fnr family transcriptional regulator [Facklamia sp. P12945]|uniref:Crp/Fnr family transcriptional regulator n=1 Tax=unclassified Facklamia TaxID=2622293 RepID=UPI003D162561